MSSRAGQQFIRRVNDSIYEVLAKLELEDGEFWCECSDVLCDDRVLTLREYAALGQCQNEPLLSRTHESTTSASS